MKFNYKLMLRIAKENYGNLTFTSINWELTPGTKYMCTLNINTIFKLQVRIQKEMLGINTQNSLMFKFCYVLISLYLNANSYSTFGRNSSYP